MIVPKSAVMQSLVNNMSSSIHSDDGPGLGNPAISGNREDCEEDVSMSHVDVDKPVHMMSINPSLTYSVARSAALPL